MMLMWGLAYVAQLLSILHGNALPQRGILPPFGILAGNLAIITTMFYAIEVIRPGWLSLKRATLCFIPFIVMVGSYLGMLRLMGESPLVLTNMDMLATNLGRFNVWYRIVMLTVTLSYLVIIEIILLRYAPSYRQWTDNNYSSPELMDVSWFTYYTGGFIWLTALYVATQLTANWYVHMAHYTTLIVFFGYVTYKGLFQRNAYPEGFFHNTMNEKLAEKQAEEAEVALLPPEESISPIIFTGFFSESLEEYKTAFDEWMRCEKPYLRTNFQKSDVAVLFPMNRTYLSRLFSEGYGKSFSQVVRQYRIEEAKRLMQKQPQLPLKQLATLCGFTSQVVFNRTFVEETGMTPKSYRALS